MRGEFKPDGTGPRDAIRGGATAVAVAATLLVTLVVIEHSLLYLTY